MRRLKKVGNPCSPPSIKVFSPASKLVVLQELESRGNVGRDSYEYEMVLSEDGKYGKEQNGQWNGMVGMVVRRGRTVSRTIKENVGK